jgi:hypothetical protein
MMSIDKLSNKQSPHASPTTNSSVQKEQQNKEIKKVECEVWSIVISINENSTWVEQQATDSGILLKVHHFDH